MYKYLLSLCVLFLIISCQESDEPEVQPELDTEAPTIPSELIANNITPSSIDLDWEEATDNVAVTGYSIYQDGNEIAEVAGTSLMVSGLTASTTYIFTVSAFDASDNESNQSNELTVTTVTPADTESPTVPQNLSALNTTITGTDLSWSPATDNVEVTGYRVYQDGDEIADIMETSFSVGGLTASTAYTFTVSAYDAVDNESNQSSGLMVTTETPSSSSRVLLFTKTAGFNHRTKGESLAMVEGFASNLNFEITVDDTGSEFDSASNLNQYDIIFFHQYFGEHLEPKLNGTMLKPMQPKEEISYRTTLLVMAMVIAPLQR